MITSEPRDDGLDPLPPPVYDADEACRSAIALAINCGFAVFPCSQNKTPTRSKAEGGGGFRDASVDPDTIESMWACWPGPLIGIATGAVSRLAVLDVDVKHPEAKAWWRQYHQYLPRTRTFRTRSGGLHLYMRPSGSIRCSEGKRHRQGIDTRGEGGYVVAWFAAGFECMALDGDFHAPIAPWPAWLTKMVWPPPAPVQPRSAITFSGPHDAAGIAGLLRAVREAPEGRRNGLLNWAGYRMRDLIARGSISSTMARQELLAAAVDAGLPSVEAIRTIGSALGAAP
jgi:Bifunctional DNA primase/polymerase, N-terminal